MILFSQYGFDLLGFSAPGLQAPPSPSAAVAPQHLSSRTVPGDSMRVIYTIYGFDDKTKIMAAASYFRCVSMPTLCSRARKSANTVRL